MKLDILATLNAERAARRAVILVTSIASGQSRLVKAADIGKDTLRAVLAEHLRTGKSGVEDTVEVERAPTDSSGIPVVDRSVDEFEEGAEIAAVPAPGVGGVEGPVSTDTGPAL